MPLTSQSGIGPEISIASGTPPADSAAGTVTGAAIDRLGFSSMVLEAETGAVTGAPSAQTLDAKVTHCDTSGGSYTDFVPGAAGSGAVAQITAASTRKRKSIDLSGAKQYLKIVTVTAFTGGTTPKMANCVKVILGGAVEKPAQADN